MKIISENELQEAADCLRNGGLVAFPTETVYGLGANALNPMAVAGIFNAKKRPNFDPLIVHISDISQIEQLFEQPINPVVYKLAAQFWPGPLTIVHRKSAIVPALVTSDLDAVAIRMPSHPIAQKLIRMAGVPVAAPSANRFGQLSPTSYKHVAKQNMEINYIVMGEDSEKMVGIESTVVSIEDNICTILRPGVITANDIRQQIPELEINTPGKNIKLSSPGLLQSHYSPAKPLKFADENFILPPNAGLILHSKTEEKAYPAKTIFTSESGNLLEVAANLFSALHQMEEDDDVTEIYIARTTNDGIGQAIMDRLNKATFRYNK
jgi:L-threonylcarbamoyladenylate synthase